MWPSVVRWRNGTTASKSSTMVGFGLHVANGVLEDKESGVPEAPLSSIPSSPDPSVLTSFPSAHCVTSQPVFKGLLCNLSLNPSSLSKWLTCRVTLFSKWPTCRFETASLSKMSWTKISTKDPGWILAKAKGSKRTFSMYTLQVALVSGPHHSNSPVPRNNSNRLVLGVW